MVTFLGWCVWKSDLFKGCWWPPTFGDKKVTAWITWNRLFTLPKTDGWRAPKWWALEKVTGPFKDGDFWYQFVRSNIHIPSLKLTAEAPENRRYLKRKGSYSNHPFSRGKLLVSGRVCTYTHIIYIYIYTYYTYWCIYLYIFLYTVYLEPWTCEYPRFWGEFHLPKLSFTKGSLMGSKKTNRSPQSLALSPIHPFHIAQDLTLQTFQFQCAIPQAAKIHDISQTTLVGERAGTLLWPPLFRVRKKELLQKAKWVWQLSGHLVVYESPFTNDHHFLYVPQSKLLILGMVIPPLIGNPYIGHLKPLL